MDTDGVGPVGRVITLPQISIDPEFGIDQKILRHDLGSDIEHHFTSRRGGWTPGSMMP